MSTNQLLYQPLPKSAALTREQVAAFEQLERSLDLMRTWLESNHYQGTVLEPVTVGQATSWRDKPILVQEDQYIYPLKVTIHTSLGAFTPPKWFAVNTSGELLSRGTMIEVSIPAQYDKAHWMSARLTGIKPIYVSDIIQAIAELIGQ